MKMRNEWFYGYEEVGLSTLRFSIYEPNDLLCLFKLSRQTLA